LEEGFRRPGENEDGKHCNEEQADKRGTEDRKQACGPFDGEYLCHRGGILMKGDSRFKPNLESLLGHLLRLSCERNFETRPEGLKEAEAYIHREFLSYGLEVFQDPFPFAGQIFSTLIARGACDPTAPRLILGAHFDAVPGTPGADDNASGVACLLEAARIYTSLRKNLSRVARTAPTAVEFVAFNCEEYGMLGSQAYAQKLKQQKARVLGMLSLEMVGFSSKVRGSQKMPLFLKPFYPDVGDFIGLVANTKSRAFLKKIKGIFQSVEGLPVESLILPANGWVFPDARLSDHSPFWDEGFEALLVTDTSFYRNPHYHSSGDRVETLDLSFLAKVTEAVARTACQLG